MLFAQHEITNVLGFISRFYTTLGERNVRVDVEALEGVLTGIREHLDADNGVDAASPFKNPCATLSPSTTTPTSTAPSNWCCRFKMATCSPTKSPCRSGRTNSSRCSHRSRGPSFKLAGLDLSDNQIADIVPLVDNPDLGSKVLRDTSRTCRRGWTDAAGRGTPQGRPLQAGPVRRAGAKVEGVGPAKGTGHAGALEGIGELQGMGCPATRSLSSEYRSCPLRSRVPSVLSNRTTRVLQERCNVRTPERTTRLFSQRADSHRSACDRARVSTDSRRGRDIRLP